MVKFKAGLFPFFTERNDFGVMIVLDGACMQRGALVPVPVLLLNTHPYKSQNRRFYSVRIMQSGIQEGGLWFIGYSAARTHTHTAFCCDARPPKCLSVGFKTQTRGQTTIRMK
jgi:hypothetical protein